MMTAKGQALFRQMVTVRMHVFAHVLFIYIYKCVEFFSLVPPTQKAFFLGHKIDIYLI